MSIKLTKIVRVEVIEGKASVSFGSNDWTFNSNDNPEPKLHEDSEFICLASNHVDASGVLVPWDLWQRVIEELKTTGKNPRVGPTVFDLSEIEGLLRRLR